MRILPVLDLMSGQVVRGMGGRRSEYRPIVSRLVQSSEPLAVAQAFRETYGLTELYLADLDAIAGDVPAFEIYRTLAQDGFQLWVDAGVRDVGLARRLAVPEVAQIVLGLETLDGPGALAEIVCAVGAERCVFSLDLKQGRPHARSFDWGTTDPLAIAQTALAGGIGRIIVLDLSRVGSESGTGTEELCGELAERNPDAEVIAGGGIRSWRDLMELKHRGVRGVLVASVLHDLRLTWRDVASFRR